MRPGTRRNIVSSLKKISEDVERAAKDVEHAELPDLRRVGVGWGVDGCTITVGGAYHFDAQRDRQHVVAIIRSLAWALFESCRDASDPEDPEMLAHVRRILEEVGNALPYGTARDTCKRCGDLSHICIACDSGCKVGWPRGPDSPEHPRATKLCPECSLWLGPREL